MQNVILNGPKYPNAQISKNVCVHPFYDFELIQTGYLGNKVRWMGKSAGGTTLGLISKNIPGL